MALPQVDATLARFGSAIEVMTANLLDLDANPTAKLLDASTLSGVTATRIAVTRQTLGRLWEHFTQFKELVDRAGELRGNGNHIPNTRIDDLDRLLHGPSISCPPVEVPLANRGLLTPAETSVSMTPEQLLADMVTAFDGAKRDILAVDEAWRVLVPRLGTAEQEIGRLTALAADLGEASDPALTRARATVTALAQAVATDPLSVEPARVAEVEGALAVVRAGLDRLAARRDGLGADLAAARSLVGEVCVLVDEGAAALAEVRGRIAGATGLLEALDHRCLTDPRSGLEPWLDRLVDMAGAANWRAARAGLDEWSAVATATAAAARQVAQVNRAPLARRDELRGLLDAYRAKAGGLGRAEDSLLCDLADQARAELYTAPTDLAKAADLVARYGAALHPMTRRAGQ